MPPLIEFRPVTKVEVFMSPLGEAMNISSNGQIIDRLYMHDGFVFDQKN